MYSFWTFKQGRSLEDIEDPSLEVAVDCISTEPSDMEDPSLGVAIDPSLGLTDGGLLGRGLSSQGSLAAVDVVIIIVGGR